MPIRIKLMLHLLLLSSPFSILSYHYLHVPYTLHGK